jgi:hypothetical protein
MISINMSNVITVNIFEFIIYAAFNLSWTKNKIADFGFMITYLGYITLSKAITTSASHQATDVKSSVSSTDFQVAETGAMVFGPFITCNALEPLYRGSGY